MKILCDKLVVVDDFSTDGTDSICLEATKHVFRWAKYTFEENESYLREFLFKECAKLCNENDWIVILDADEILLNPNLLRNTLENLETSVKNLGLRLYDMWNDTQYREDQYWNAHKRYWNMCYRYTKTINYTWNRSKLHCGRLPNEIYNFNHAICNYVYIKHMGWSTEKDRKNKYYRYIRLDPKGEYGILEQYESILDKNPNLIDI